MTDRYARSALWEHNNTNEVTAQAVADLSDFKSNEVNFKLALWDPRTNGVRYLKTLIYQLGMSLSTENQARLAHIQNREVGNPISVRCLGQDVCMDYLMSVYELEFLQSTLDLRGMRVLEIGAGYGRSCHAILSNCELDSYHIVDLTNSLMLAKAYLARVLTPAQLAKVRFVEVEQLDESIEGLSFDLCLNIDSFAEMDPGAVADYLSLIREHCSYLYVNNPVGKYLDKSLDGHAQGQEVVAMALRTGPLQQIIDIHDSAAVQAQCGPFLQAYRPGADWVCIAHKRVVPWTYYWQALYAGPTAGQHVIDC